MLDGHVLLLLIVAALLAWRGLAVATRDVRDDVRDMRRPRGGAQ